jgi:tetratricopeptide (TPR) repeat protein
LGAAAAAFSALLGVLANLSEIAGLFSPDETRDLVQETRVAVQDTDTKVSELLVLLRNQAAATGLDLNFESETAIRNAIQAIVVSGNAQKQQALDYLAEGEVATAADMMAAVAGNQASAVAETGLAAAESWREAGALYYSLDIAKAINAYEEANRLEPRDPETLEMLGYALVRAGRLDDAEATFIECLELLPRPAVYASVYVGRAGIARQRGEYALANEYLSQALTTAEAAELAAERVHALIGLAAVAREQGDTERAQLYLQDGLQASVGLRDESLRAKVLSNLGILEANREDFDAARRLIQDARDIYVEKKDLAGQSVTIGNLGALALLSGALDDAETYLLRSVEIGEQLGWRSSVAYDLSNLGGIARKRQDYAAADGYLLRAEDIAKEVGLAELLPVIVANRGEVAFESGDVESACRFWSEAAPVLASMGSAHAVTVNQMANDAACPVAVGDRVEP